MAISSSSIGQEICKILGLDPAVTAKVSIILTPSDVVRVEVLRFLTDDKYQGIKKVFEGYTVTLEKKEVKEVTNGL